MSSSQADGRPANSAAWLTARRRALSVDSTPYTAPSAHEIVVRNRAVAVNPLDWIIPTIGGPVYPWIKPPAILGSDVAGDVVEVGADVTRFAVGDRVLGHAVGVEKSRNRGAEGAFQHYTVLLEHMASPPIPDALAYANAAVLPLGLSTAACGLFQADQLGLRLPCDDAPPAGETVVVWGGATSVGSNAIQLATAAGYDVVTTCSPRNFDYVRGLGAREARDYRSPTVVDDLVAVLKDRPVAGAIALGNGSTRPCVKVIARCTGRRLVAQASTPVSFAGLYDNPRGLPLLMLRFAAAGFGDVLAARTRRVRTKFIWGASLMDDEIGPAIYASFLPRALADGSYQAVPEPHVVGHSLQSIQHALDTQRAGVSAQKVVVALPA